MATQPQQPPTDFLAALRNQRQHLYTTLVTSGLRTGLASDGVHVGALTPQAVGACISSFGAGPTKVDLTTPANEATADDVTLFATVPAVTDALYIGHLTKKFTGIKVTISTSGAYTSCTFAWEYWNGTAWVALPAGSVLADSTIASTKPWAAAPGTYFITFAPPADWAKTSVNNGATNVSGYYVRSRCTHVGTGVTQGLATRLWLLVPGVTTPGSGMVMPFTGQLLQVIHRCNGTLSGTTADTKLLLVNVTSGGSYVFTATKGAVQTIDSSPSLSFSAGDQIAVQCLQGDGSTEFANTQLTLAVGPI